MRRKPGSSLIAVLLCVLLSWTVSPPFIFAHCDAPLDISGPLQEALEGAARRPDGEVALLRTILLASTRGSMDLTGRPGDAASVEKEVGRLAARVASVMGKTRAPRKVVSAFNRVVFDEERYKYDPVAGDPDNYLLDRVIERKRGNCLGLSVLYLALAERLGIPLGGVYVPSHCFVRYEEGGARINVEMGEKGAENDDQWYAKRFRLANGRPYLATLGKREMIGVYLKSLAAAYSKKGMHEEALRHCLVATRFSPGLPDAYFNAGVAYQKLGKTEDAIAHYLRALAVDPELAAARGNLAAAYCTDGKIEEGIREFRKVLEFDPKNVLARAGLAKACFARGDYREAIEHCDQARELGCRFEPSMLEVLNRYRASGAVPR